MKIPIGLLAGGLLFWGWQTDFMVAAASLALVLEGARFIRARWDFSELDFRRVWTLCTMLFIGATIYAFSANEGVSGFASLFTGESAPTRDDSLNKTSRSVLTLIQWLPLIFFPMMLAQAYSSRDTIDLRVFSWLLRTRAARNSHAFSVPEINLAYPYLVVCLLATSTTQRHPQLFFVGLFLVLAWTLWSFRSRRFAPGVWILLVVVSGLLGFAGQLGLSSLHKVLQHIETGWFSRFSRHEVDTSANRTALGVLGNLKLSGRIVLRVHPVTQPAPGLLREASYNVFDSPWWGASRNTFQNLVVEQDETTWRLLPDKPTRRAVRIALFLRKGRGVLPMPTGTAELRELPVFTVKTNELGAFRVDAGPGLVDFISHYDSGLTIDAPPMPEDRAIPGSELEAVEAIARELELDGADPETAIAKLEEYFRARFEYSAFDRRRDRRARETPLTRFLTRTRSGHCEYFASATALILRAAGIPTRYALGFALIERDGQGYVARERHAHAWCLAYVNNSWRDVDTTPPSWGQMEAQSASSWESVGDLASRIWFHFSKWRWSKTSLRPYLLLILIPPVILILARLLFRRRARRSPTALPARRPPRPGIDSEFYLVEQRLIKLGWERPVDQPLLRWLRQAQLPHTVAPEQLIDLASLHYRYRFDPFGLDAHARSALREKVHGWLKATLPGRAE